MSEYDAGGNRTLKKEAANVSINPLRCFEERYEYHVSGNEIKYRTANNRLMTMVRELHVNAALPNDDVGYVG